MDWTDIWSSFVLILPSFLKKQLKMHVLMWSNVFDGDVTDVEAFEFTKNTKI